MPLKLQKNVSYTTCTEGKDESDQDNKNFLKIQANTKNLNEDIVEVLYLALICFVIHCLSCITLETGGRSSYGSPVTKSAAFNAIFRRTYNLKIIILITNVITGLITTLMMIFADKYNIPYLYLPWLVNTMKGMTLCEGPALFNIANTLLSNITLPITIFVLTTFFLYVEEFCIWSNIFFKFQHCWKNYHNEKHFIMEKTKKRLYDMHNKKLLSQDNIENEIDIGYKKLKFKQKPIEFCNINDRISTDVRLRPVKSSTFNNGNFIRNQLLDITG